MKSLIPSLALISTIVSTCHAGPFGFLTPKHRDRNFLQSVEGMKVGLEKKKLVVSCDDTELKEITKRPISVNSGMVVRKLMCVRVDDIISLSLDTSIAEKGKGSTCGSINISAYPLGTYSVVYLNPDGSTEALRSFSRSI